MKPVGSICDDTQIHLAKKLSLKTEQILIKKVYRAESEELSSTFVFGIPTSYLAEVFWNVRAQISNAQALSLFVTLSSHWLTRTAAGWAHEQCMHAYMTGTGKPLSLLPSGLLHPTTRMLSGTVNALSYVGGQDNFYWFPSVEDFEGVDALLGEKDDIYALQATIVDEHRSPIQGLRKVWNAIAPVARLKKWHIVYCGGQSGSSAGLY
ncbi:hypothetical protein CPB83DRAFT_819839 [Crepidotus variabilis]|uniref:Uncharacterized protein n=1 Tax=Crepidotus variabilis TaxID=179855 RepID=A0A9P6E8Z8_9AGAR|nr:hypothetical protein CPB83DRAFT_819839 [Crepidotus variabilis]